MKLIIKEDEAEVVEMKKIQAFLPCIIGFVISVVAFSVYLATTKEISALLCIQILACPLILIIFPVLNLTKKVRIPIVFSYVLLIHLVLALVLGSGFGFYEKIACWDMILHGYFGFVASFLIFIVLINYNGEKLNSILFFVIIFFITMGLAGLWEIYEFIADRILNGDAQRVEESILQGHTPVYDTMMDMIISISGIIGFYVCIGIDKLCGYRITKYLYKDIKNISKE